MCRRIACIVSCTSLVLDEELHVPALGAVSSEEKILAVGSYGLRFSNLVVLKSLQRHSSTKWFCESFVN